MSETNRTSDTNPSTKVEPDTELTLKRKSSDPPCPKEPLFKKACANTSELETKLADMDLNSTTEPMTFHFKSGKSLTIPVSVKTYTLTENPDCTLTLRDRAGPVSFYYMYRVSKTIVSTASAVLKQTILRGLNEFPIKAEWSGSDPGCPESLVYLRVFDTRALHNILKALHWDNDKSLFSPNFSDLPMIAEVIDAFKLQKAMSPWIHIWINLYADSVLAPGFENWLYIAKIFQTKKGVYELVKELSKDIGWYKDPASVDGGYYLRGKWSCGTQTEISCRWLGPFIPYIMWLRSKEVNRLFRIHSQTMSFLKNISLSPGKKYCNSDRCAYLLCESYLVSTGKIKPFGVEMEYYTRRSRTTQFSVSIVEDKLSQVLFETLADIDPTHQCSLSRVRKTFLAKIKREDITGPEYIKEIFPTAEE